MTIANDGGSNAHVIHNGITIYITEKPRLGGVINSDISWCARGEDEEGHDYLITWTQLKSYKGEDDSDPCDWDDFEVTKM